jgi:hypothetical protein
MQFLLLTNAISDLQFAFPVDRLVAVFDAEPNVLVHVSLDSVAHYPRADVIPVVESLDDIMAQLSGSVDPSSYSVPFGG